ncbi:AAA family ATPase [Myxococcota bacterium]|jgi:predicted ATPase|nr:AAA family ATPase [Myxococcota bacterium]
MRIEQLTLSHIKRVESLTIDFPPVVRAGTPSERAPWTVIIGENGTCKTTILQAIALTAAGELQASRLAGPSAATVAGRVAMRAQEAPRAQVGQEATPAFTASASATFTVTSADLHVLGGNGGADCSLRSSVELAPGQVELGCTSAVVDGAETTVTHFGRNPLTAVRRHANARGLFVAAYGVNRPLPEPGHTSPSIVSVDRLSPLFADAPVLVGPGFFQYFLNNRQDELARKFARIVNRVLAGNTRGLLPGLNNIVLQGIRSNGSVFGMSREFGRQRMGESAIDVPTSALAHGFQSTLAWVADLIGHALLLDDSIEDSTQMTGLVLIDEIDLYVHPTLQVSLIRDLMAAFPRMQFVVTTHSPLVLAAMRPDEDEIVRLRINESSGLVEAYPMKEGRQHEPDARLMTVAEVLERYFGRESVFAGVEGSWLVERQSIAHNPYRSDEEDRRLQELTNNLTSAGVRVRPAVPRAGEAAE